MKRAIDRTTAEAEPHEIWNAFVDLLSMEDFDSLTKFQRTAHLAYWYDSEVQNGGHGQFFDNRGVEQLAETVDALKALGLRSHAELLSRARSALAKGGSGRGWEDVLEDEFIEELDEAFERCEPTITEALERHLAKHRAEYVDLT